MGVVRYQIVQLEPFEQERFGPVGRFDDVYDVHKIELSDTTSLSKLADVCARMTRTLCDEGHTAIWALIPYFDSDADVTQQNTVELFLRDTPKVSSSTAREHTAAPVRVIRETAPIRPLGHFVSPKPWYDKRDVSQVETTELTPRWLLDNGEEE